MPKIIRLLFRFESEYSSDPQFISGNALRHALSSQLNTSVGIFTRSALLDQPKTYEEFFAYRTKKCFLHPYFELWYDKRNHRRAFRYFFLPEAVTFDVLNPPENLIELIQGKEFIQFGGNRNCGFGMVRLQDSIEINVDQLQFPDRASHLTFLSPSIVVPPYVERYKCRYMPTTIWNHAKANVIQVIAPGQFFRIKPGKSVSTVARKGLLRKGLFGQFGFGEFMVHNWNKQEAHG